VLLRALAVVYSVSMSGRDVPWLEGHKQAEGVDTWKYWHSCIGLIPSLRSYTSTVFSYSPYPHRDAPLVHSFHHFNML
jgi:hypothetical protein